MSKWLLPLFFCFPFSPIHSATITTSFTSSSSGILPFSPLTLPNGFRIENTPTGFRFTQNGQPVDIPGRFHVTSSPADQSNILVSQWDNFPNVPSSFPPFIVSNPFTVVRTNGQFRIQGTQPFDLPGSSFYVERISSTQSRVTASGTSTTSTNTQQTGSSQTGGQNPAQPPAQPQSPLQDRTKPDGTTDCGPNIAYLCNNPLYAQLMRDQCPATCANFPNAPAPIQTQQIAQQPVAVGIPQTIWNPFRNFGGLGGMCNSCCRGRK